jgi:2-keto-3-deoxy-L-rhamnonate aldolase RhmA
MKNKLSLGSWITLGHMGIVEVMAGAGFDWLCIDLEHSVIDYYDVQVLISTIQSKKLKAFVRVGANDATIIKRVLDAGADGIICPMINDAAQTRQLVSHVKYPSAGSRGVGLARAQNYGLDSGFEIYKDVRAKEVIIIAQIEHYEAIVNLEEIIEVDGLDGTFIGPYDLSGSMGKPGQFEDEDVKEMLVKYESLAKKNGKYMGFHVIKPEASLVKEKIIKGYDFIAFSIDTLFLGTLCRNELLKIKNQ